MGKIYIARFENGTERDVASMSMGHAKLFYELTCVLERSFVPLASGLVDDVGLYGPQDAHVLDAEQFVLFFEAFWKEGWLGEKDGGLLYGWAQEAAGIVENITLTPREWIDRSGKTLEVRRYLRTEEITQRLADRGIAVSPKWKGKR